MVSGGWISSGIVAQWLHCLHIPQTHHLATHHLTHVAAARGHAPCAHLACGGIGASRHRPCQDRTAGAGTLRCDVARMKKSPTNTTDGALVYPVPEPPAAG